ncbi:MAG: preprotein translocase subunit SecG [Clostridia bacterium]
MLDLLNFSILAASTIDKPNLIPQQIREGVVIAFSVLMVLASIAIVIIIMMQKGTNDNVGVISGASDTFYGKNKQKGKESLMKKITFGIFAFIIVCAIICFVIMQLGGK